MADGKTVKTIVYHGNGTVSGDRNADLRKIDAGADENGHKPRGSANWQNFTQND